MYLKDVTSMTEQSGSSMSEPTATTPMLRLLRGGKGPPSDNTPHPDWLSPLKVGAVFSCSKKGQAENYVLGLLIVVFKHGKTVILSDGLNNQPRVAVDPVEFCKRHTLFEVIEEGGELPEGENNGNSEGSLRPGGMDDDADAEGRQPEHDPVEPK